MENWNFPIGSTEFISYQENLAGRKLENWEREFAAESVDIINEAYQDGKAEVSTDLYPRTPDEVWREGITHNPEWSNRQGVRRLLSGLVHLCNAAWEMGKQEGASAQ